MSTLRERAAVRAQLRGRSERMHRFNDLEEVERSRRAPRLGIWPGSCRRLRERRSRAGRTL
jgi:hypothetical protein